MLSELAHVSLRREWIDTIVDTDKMHERILSFRFKVKEEIYTEKGKIYYRGM